MKIVFYSSNEETLKELGRRIKTLRIGMSVTQAEMAEKTNLSVKTISNIENGKDASFSSIIEILRVLGMLQNLDVLLPENQIRPSQIYESGKVRERASGKKYFVEDVSSGWKWGDEK